MDPFTLSSIVISFALHIGHIGYTIYQNAPAIKAEIVKIEEDVVDIIENPGHLSQDVEKMENEFQKTVELIESANALLQKKEIYLLP